MNVLRDHVSSIAGATLTTLLFLAPFPYALAPAVGGVLTGAMERDGPVAGAKSGALLGLFLVPGAVLAALLLAGGVVPANSGAVAYASAMSNAGPRNVVFHAIFAYSYSLYSSLFGLLAAAVVSAVVPVGRTVVRAES